VFVGFPRILLQGILIFKGLTARRLNKSFGVKGLINYQMFDLFPTNPTPIHYKPPSNQLHSHTLQINSHFTAQLSICAPVDLLTSNLNHTARLLTVNFHFPFGSMKIYFIGLFFVLGSISACVDLSPLTLRLAPYTFSVKMSDVTV
jgi:hypothetical protein